MPNLSDSSPDSTPKVPRKRTPKPEPTEAELEEAVAVARKRLQELRTRNRITAITRLGTLAYNAGLAPLDDDTLKTEFAALAKRLGKVVCIVSMGFTLLTMSGCFPGSKVDREWQKLLGVRTPEEQVYCHTVQQQYLTKSVPEVPPSCDDLLKVQREKATVLP